MNLNNFSAAYCDIEICSKDDFLVVSKLLLMSDLYVENIRNYSTYLDEAENAQVIQSFHGIGEFVPGDSKFVAHTFRTVSTVYGRKFPRNYGSVRLTPTSAPSQKSFYINRLNHGNSTFNAFVLKVIRRILDNVGANLSTNMGRFDCMYPSQMNPLDTIQGVAKVWRTLSPGLHLIYDKRVSLSPYTKALSPKDFVDLDGLEKITVDMPGAASSVVAYLDEYATFVVVPHDFYDTVTDTGAGSKRVFTGFLMALYPALEKALDTPEMREKRVRDNVISGLSEFYGLAVQRKRNLVSDLRIQKTDAGAAFSNLINKIRVASYELEGLLNSAGQIEDIKKTANEELDSLFKFSKVTDISIFAGTSLQFTTKFLYFTNPSTNVVHQLGRVKVTVNMHDFSIKFHNMDMKYGRFDHPHINAGQICYGNFGVGLPELIQEGRLFILVDQIVSFLETCNPEDEWGKNAVYWPVEDASQATAQWKERYARLDRGLVMPKVSTENLPPESVGSFAVRPTDPTVGILYDEEPYEEEPYEEEPYEEEPYEEEPYEDNPDR